MDASRVYSSYSIYLQVGSECRKYVVYGVRPRKIRPPLPLWIVSSPTEHQSYAIPTQFFVPSLFQLGIEVSRSILRNHPGDKVSGGNPRGTPRWQEFTWW